MKTFRLLLVLLTLTSCCYTSKSNKNFLNGNVKSTTENSVSFSFNEQGVVERTPFSKIKSEFGTSNNILKKTEESLSFDEIAYTTYNYDRCNNLLRKDVTRITNDEEMNSETQYEYENNLLAKTHFESISEDWSYCASEQYTYDSEDNLILSKTTILLIDTKTKDTIEKSIQTDKYNENEHIRYSNIFDSNNPNKDKAVEYFYQGDQLIKLKEYNYKSKLTNTMRFEYKLDEMNNWIEQKTFNNDTLSFITTREIEYY